MITNNIRERFIEEGDIAHIFTSFFKNIFSNNDPTRTEEAVQVVQGRVSNERFMLALNLGSANHLLPKVLTHCWG